MSRTQFLIYAGVLLLLASGQTACSALATPRQIATYPLSTPYAQPGLARVYDTYLDLEVPDVEEAAEKAIHLTYQVGGLLLETRSWQQEGSKHTTLVLAALVSRSEALRSALLELGTPLQEQLSSRIISRSGEDPNTYAYFTVHLQERGSRLIAIPTTSWRPIRTLARAWSVFVSIFGFLVDVLIWVTVIPGPFILIGLVVWFILRRYRSRHVSRM